MGIIGFVRKKRSSALGDVWNQTLTSNVGGWSGYTMRMRLLNAALTLPSGTPTTAYITLTASTIANFVFDKVYIGHYNSAGDAPDATSLTQVLFSGVAGATITAGVPLRSDAVSFAYDKTSGLIVSLHSSGTSAARYATLTNTETYYKAAVDEAATANVSGGTYTAAGYLTLVSRIEMDGF